MSENFTNFAKTTLGSGITNSATSITVADGSNFPTSDFSITIGDGSSREIVHIASRSGNTLTADERGWQGTSPDAHSSGETVIHTVLAHHMDSGPGAELGYSESLSNFSTTSGTFVEITGLNTTVEVGDRPIYVELSIPAVAHSAAGGRIVIQIQENGVQIGEVWTASGTAARAVSVHRAIRRNPAPGEYTYNAHVRQNDAGTITIYGNGTVNAGPFCLFVREA